MVPISLPPMRMIRSYMLVSLVASTRIYTPDNPVLDARPSSERCPQRVEALAFGRIAFDAPEAFANDAPCAGNKKAEESHQHHDEGARWKRLPVRGYGSVHHLHNPPLPSLVEFGNFEFLRQQLVDGLIVLEIPQPAEVFHPRFCHSPLGKVDV